MLQHARRCCRALFPNRRDPFVKLIFDLFDRRVHERGLEIIWIERLTVKCD
jgi:hypothetical protein